MSSYQINFENSIIRFSFDENGIRRIIDTILSNCKIKQALLNIVLVGDEFITDLHKNYLQKNSTTDVISFVLENDSGNENIEGEVYANLEQVERQAIEYKVASHDELNRVIIHGVLHLVGYNDQTPDQRIEMTKKEDYYLSLIKN